MPDTHADVQLEFDLVSFAAGGERTRLFSLDTVGGTIWATGSEIADLFRAPASLVAKHVAAVYAAGELEAGETRRALPGLAADGTRSGPPAEHYNLDVILSVGYRISSAKATAFRRWADRVLRALLVDGFVIDAARLGRDASAREGLASRLRAIRAEESSVYESVRAFFAAGAADHEADSEAARAFARLLDDKILFAVTGKAPPALLMERADHAAPAMGLRQFGGALPSMDEARVAQNYLDAHEIFLAHVLCEQFLLLVQQNAARGRRMTMASLTDALDGLLRADDYPVLPSHKQFHAARAVRHAQAEYARFVMGRGAARGSVPPSRLEREKGAGRP